MQHPGPALEPRQIGQWAEGARAFTLKLAAGTDLMEGLVETLQALGVAQAGINLLGGELAEIGFMTGRPDDSGYRIATHNGPWHLPGPLTLLGGTAILGLDAEGAALLHCHGLFADAGGKVRGGHLRSGECPLGAAGLTAVASCPQGAGFQVAFDPESNFPIFQTLNAFQDADPS